MRQQKKFLLIGILFLTSIFILPTNEVLAFSGSGSGTSNDPYQISTCDQLQSINENLSANYTLAGDIDCTQGNPENPDYNLDGEVPCGGFNPIGNVSENIPFSGNLDGYNHTINGVCIGRGDTAYVGIFALVSGSIKNINLTDVDISGSTRTGSLVGKLLSDGTVENVNVSGTVYGNAYTGGVIGGSLGHVSNTHFNGSVFGANYTGGLIGGISGSSGDHGVVDSSSSSGTVSGGIEEVGGLVGVINTYADVSNSSSSSNVQGNWTVGGLVGSVLGTVTSCYATGNVTSNGGYGVGGLVGYLTSGSITKSYATGDVSAVSGNEGLDLTSSYAGGLVGVSDGGSITKSYATGDVSGSSIRVGGLVGGTNSLVENSYATGDVTGEDRVGGLVGGLGSPGEIKNSYSVGKVVGIGTVSSSGDYDGGGGGGGYFGGEGGQGDASPGAGGSGFLKEGIVTDGALIAGSNGYYEGALPPKIDDTDYSVGVGVGGVRNSAGGNGRVSLSYGSGDKQSFAFTGGAQTFEVPADITSLEVKVWGAGGGGGTYNSDSLYNTYQGGAGGFASGTLAVTPGQTLVIIVGGGGGYGFSGTYYAGQFGYGGAGGFGGGGDGTKGAGFGGDAPGGGGGGLSGIFTNDNGTNFSSLTQSDALIIAGGGGGGTGYSGAGGGGGGIDGRDGGASTISCSGSQSAGGACLEFGSDGSALRGGNGDSRGSIDGGIIAATQTGGLVGFTTGTIISSFWDTQSSEQSGEITGASGKATADMKNILTYSQSSSGAWDIFPFSSYLNNSIWYINDTAYPQLGWQTLVSIPDPAPDPQPTPNLVRSPGNSVQSQVANLMALGNKSAAENLQKQYPHLFVSDQKTATTSSTITKSHDLEFGVIDKDVKQLQIWLNSHGYIIAKTGAGSLGKETDRFGALTMAALIKFQKVNHITPASGYFGPKTRAVMEKI